MYIIIREGSKNSYRVNLDSYGKDVVSFGRNTDNDIVLNSSSVSRVHGCFYKESGGWKISDLDSTNGLYAGGYKVKEKVIDKYTEIKIKDSAKPDGQVVFTFEEGKYMEKENIMTSNMQVSSNTSGLFVDASEVQKAMIGGGYIANVVRGGRFSKGYGVLTDKRFYFSGRCYTKNNAYLTKTDEEWTVDLGDITSTGFVYKSYIGLLITAILGLISGLILAIGEESGEMAIYTIIATLILYIAYYLSKRVLYFVTFAGGSIGVDASKYGGTQVVREFDKMLRREKDKYKSHKI